MRRTRWSVPTVAAVVASGFSTVAAGVAMTMVLTVGSGASASAPTRTGPAPAAAGQPAAAAQVAATAKGQNFKDGLQQFRKDHEAAPAKVKADAVARVKDQIASGKLVTHLPDGAHLAIERARAAVGPEGTLVAIPIQGAGLHAASGLTVQIGKNGALHSGESQFKPTGPNSGVVTTWQDGVLTHHESASNDGKSAPATGAVPKATSGGDVLQAGFASGGHIQQASYWDGVKKCLEDDYAIPGWVLGIIGGPCVAAGPACAAAISLYYGDAALECMGM